MKMELIKSIDSQHIGSLCDLLVEFQEEVFNANTKIDIENLLLYNDIYIVIEDDEVIAFVSFTTNTYFGFRDPTIYCNYLHIAKGKRKGRAIMFISKQIVAVVEDKQLPLEFCFATSSSFNFGQKIEGKKVYDTYIYESSKVIEAYGKHAKYFKKRRLG